jgi:protease I
LITADVLRGRMLICYKSIIQDIINAGANLVDQDVVEDNNLITRRNPGDLPVFIKATLNRL